MLCQRNEKLAFVSTIQPVKGARAMIERNRKGKRKHRK